MFSVEPQVAFWIGALLVLAAVSYAEVSGSKSGHSFVGDLFAAFGGPKNG